MWKIFILVSCLKGACMASSITSLHEFKTSEGFSEYHCFDEINGVKNYVRGTYGSYGYFEGRVDSLLQNIFHVNWFEVDIFNSIPVSGAAVLNYTIIDNSWTKVNGPTWRTGSSDIIDSYESWTSENGTFQTDDRYQNSSNIILEKCLYAGINRASSRLDIDILTRSSVSGFSVQGKISFCKIPAGPAGSWLGTYEYIENNNVEFGNYGLNPFGFFLRSGMGFVGNWKATRGLFKNSYGSSLYMITIRSSKVIIVGFFCKDGICSNERYDVDGTSSSMNTCPQLYQDDNSLAKLYEFSSVGTGHSTSSRSSDEDDHSIAFICAIIFGIFSFLELVILIYFFNSERIRQLKIEVE